MSDETIEYIVLDRKQITHAVLMMLDLWGDACVTMTLEPADHDAIREEAILAQKEYQRQFGVRGYIALTNSGQFPKVAQREPLSMIGGNDANM